MIYLILSVSSPLRKEIVVRAQDKITKQFFKVFLSSHWMSFKIDSVSLGTKRARKPEHNARGHSLTYLVNHVLQIIQLKNKQTMIQQRHPTRPCQTLDATRILSDETRPSRFSVNWSLEFANSTSSSRAVIRPVP